MLFVLGLSTISSYLTPHSFIFCLTASHLSTMAIHSLYIFLAIVISAFQVSAREGLHLAAHGLLQVSPSFSTDGISLYPAHRPGHNAADIAHLTPTRSNELYYSQEGHRRKYQIELPLKYVTNC